MTDEKKNKSTVDTEGTTQKIILAWMAGKLGGAKESLGEFAKNLPVNLPTAPIAWLTPEEKKYLHLQGQEEFLENLTKFHPVFNYEQAKSSPVSTEMKVARTAARGAASVGIFLVDSIAAVGMAIAKSPKRAVGSLALFGNMLRHGIHAIEDKAINNNKELQANVKLANAYKERRNFLKILEEKIKNLEVADSEKLDKITEKILNIQKPEQLDHLLEAGDRNFLKRIGGKLDQTAALLLESQKSVILAEAKKEEIYAKRDANDKTFDKIPGVKEMKENIKIAKDAANYALEGVNNIGTSIYNKVTSRGGRSQS